MKIPMWLVRKLRAWAEAYIQTRPPDFIIGAKDPAGAYMERWWVIPRNKWFNVYLHLVLRNDNDEALHDHPWWNISIPLRSGYREIIPVDPANPAGPTKARLLWPGSVTFRKAHAAHRIEIFDKHTQPNGKPGLTWAVPGFPISLLITGPVVREWGFHCPKGWRSFKEFTKHAEGAYGERGQGCGD